MTTYENWNMQRLSFLTVQAMLHGSSWDDVMAKAKRLVLNGQVDVIRNTPTLVSGVVQGDHGTYKNAISRHDPDSQVIEQWVCQCPWHQYAFMRTRQWKKLEGRVCSHVLALYMQARMTPLDTTGEEPGFKAGPGQRVGPAGPGQMSFDDQIADQQAREQGLTRDQVLQMQDQDQIEQPLPYMGEDQQGTEPPPNTPEQQDAIPQAPEVPPGSPPPVNPWTNLPRQQPANPLYQQMTLWDATVPNAGGPGLPAINPVSIPGGRPSSPLNPLDQLGTGGINTLSHLSSIVYSTATDFAWHFSKNPFEDWATSLLARGFTPRVMFKNPVHLEARGGKIPVPGAVPVGETSDGIPQYRTLDLGWNPTLQRRMNADEGGPHGRGAPELLGQFHEVQPGMQAELRYIEPKLKSAFVAVPLPGSGPLHPKELSAWVDYDDITAHPNQRSPFAPPTQRNYS